MSLLHTGLPTLYDRRVSLCRTFAQASLANPDLARWFPSRQGDRHNYNLRNNNQRGLPEMTERLENSPESNVVKLHNE